MAMSTEVRKEIGKLAADRESALRRAERAQEDVKKLSAQLVELLEAAGVKKVVVDGREIALSDVIDWWHFDQDAAAQDFPIDEHPEIYRPDYKLTKKMLNEHAKLGEKDTRLIARYTGFKQILRVGTPRRANLIRKKAA